jgi:glutamate synthase domain-containing protein 3
VSIVNTSDPSLVFHLGSLTPAAILAEIRNRAAMPSDQGGIETLEVTIQGASGQDFIGAGIRRIGKVNIQGEIGDFGLCSFGDGECNVDGNVRNFFGHSIQSGVLVVRGHAKNYVGALGAGGLITIYGNAGARVAVGLQGADVVIRGSVDTNAGLGMQSGTLIIGGAAGPELGKGMKGGTIYIRGEAESISPDIEEQRLREPDRLKIGLLMLKSGIKSTGKEFRAYRPVHADV